MSSFVLRVLDAFKGDLGDEGLNVTLAPFRAEAARIVGAVYKYEYDATTALTILREVTMASLVKGFSTCDSASDQFPELFPLFTETGLVAEARLFATLYLSLGKEPQEICECFWGDLLKIKIVDSGSVGDVPFSELKTWALKLLSHPRANHLIKELLELAQPFGTKAKFTINLTDLVSQDRVHFFSSPDAQLWGFSGIDSLFINIFALQKAHEVIKKLTRWDPHDECLALQTKMMVAVIGFHITVHLAVRKAINQVNEVEFGFSRFKFLYCVTSDVGFIAQMRLFDAYVNWVLLSSHKSTIHAIFKFFSLTPADPESLSPPVFEVKFLHLPAEPAFIYNGIYKMGTELLNR